MSKSLPLHKLFLRSPPAVEVTACFIAGFLYWLLICVIMRLTLKILLTYRGFMFESRGKGVSLKTKIWGVMLRSRLKKN